MTSRLWLLMVADPPLKTDTPEAGQAKAEAAVLSWCTQLVERGEKVTYAGVIPSRPGGKGRVS